MPYLDFGTPGQSKQAKEESPIFLKSRHASLEQPSCTLEFFDNEDNPEEWKDSDYGAPQQPTEIQRCTS